MSLEKYSWLETESRLLFGSKRYNSKKHLVIPFEPSLYKGLFDSAHLIIPDGKSLEPYIKLSQDAVLKCPHVGSDGEVCLQTELRSNLTEEQFIRQLIEGFCDKFLTKMITGEIRQDFYDEPENYWTIFVNQFANNYRKKTVQVNSKTKKTFGVIKYPNQLLLIDKKVSHYIEYESKLIDELCIIAGSDSSYKTNFLRSYSCHSQKNLMTLEIPINQCYIPKKWPKTIEELSNVITIFGDDELAKKYTKPFKLIILRAPNCNYAYFINKENKLIPFSCDKADIEWIYGRNKNNNIIKNQAKKIVCFGAGSLGSQVIPLLVKEGVGEIIVVDYDRFDTPNLGRHLLGIKSLDNYKASEIKKYVNTHLPTCHINTECIRVYKWLEKAKSNNLLNNIDLFIDLTGSEEVRNILDEVRHDYNIPLITGWMEPFVSAAHVVYFPNNKSWKTQEIDFWEEIAAFKGWPNNYLENEPGCSSHFQAYSGIEALKAVSLIAEVCASFLSDKDLSNSSQIEVTSLVRGSAFCERQEYIAEARASWAEVPEILDSIIIKRLFE